MTIAEKITRAKADIDAVYEAGKKAEYDAFWDKYQQKGNRASYAYAFSGEGWTTNNFKPKYDVIVKTTARRMFAGAEGLVNTNIAQLFEELGITLDTSGVTSVDGFNEFCEYSGPKVFPTIDTTGCPRLSTCFFYASFLTTIQKLILKSDGSQTFSKVFIGCTNLTNLTIEGVIGQNGFDVQYSKKLSKASIESIINALSTTTSGLTVTLSQEAVNNAFTAEEWAALIATRNNWTISLV